MSGQIFISYRREDSAPWARLAHQSLAQRFPQRRIFMDVDNLPPRMLQIGQTFPFSHFHTRDAKGLGHRRINAQKCVFPLRADLNTLNAP